MLAAISHAYSPSMRSNTFRDLNDTLRTDDFLERVSAISSPTDDRKIHFALVWRNGLGLDDLYVVFPSGAAVGVLLFASRHQTLGRQKTVDPARGFADRGVGVFTGATERNLEAQRVRGSDLANDVVADSDDRVSILPALDDWAADSGLAKQNPLSKIRVPPVCGFQFWLVAGFDRVSVFR